MSESKSLFLIVKGPPDVALTEAARHGMPVVKLEGQCRGIGNYYNTYLRAATGHGGNCQKWFDEDLGRAAPFREGALLWWSYSPKEA